MSPQSSPYAAWRPQAKLSPIILDKVAAARANQTASPPQLDVVRVLAASEWYARLSERMRGALLEGAEIVKHPGAQPLRSLGDDQTLDVVLEGAIRVAIGASGVARTLMYLPPGQWFADPGLLGVGPRIYALFSHGPTTVLTVSGHRLVELQRSDVQVTQALARLHFLQSKRVTSLLQESTSLPLQARLACCLERLCEDFGVTERGRVRIALDVRQGELGRMVGASRQRVNRELGLLESRGIASVEGRYVAADLDALRALIAEIN